MIVFSFLNFNIMRKIKKKNHRKSFLKFCLNIYLIIFDHFIIDLLKWKKSKFFSTKIKDMPVIIYFRFTSYFFLGLCYSNVYLIKIKNIINIFIQNSLYINIKQNYLINIRNKKLLLFNYWTYTFQTLSQSNDIFNYKQYLSQAKKFNRIKFKLFKNQFLQKNLHKFWNFTFKNFYPKTFSKYAMLYLDFSRFALEKLKLKKKDYFKVKKTKINKLNFTFLDISSVKIKKVIFAPLESIYKSLITLGFLKILHYNPKCNLNFLKLKDFKILKIYCIFIYNLLLYYRTTKNFRDVNVICNYLYKSCILTLARKYDTKKVWMLKRYNYFIKIKTKNEFIKLVLKWKFKFL